jgi:hypothetical protein
MYLMLMMLYPRGGAALLITAVSTGSSGHHRLGIGFVIYLSMKRDQCRVAVGVR